MEAMLDLGKMLFLGAGLGLLVGVLMKWNQYKDSNMREKLYKINSPQESTSDINPSHVSEEQIVSEEDYMKEWELSKKKK